jgi:hypothetical protein
MATLWWRGMALEDMVDAEISVERGEEVGKMA